MSKEAFIDAHEQLVAEYLDRHPDALWSKAYEVTADAAYNRMKDNFADLGDRLKDQAKEGNK